MAAVGFAIELLSLYQTASVGMTGTNMFASTSAVLPANIPCLNIVETGGAGVDFIQNKDLPNVVYATAQVMALALTYEAARALAYAAWRASSKFNFTVSGVKYMSLRPLQAQPINLPVDPQGRARCAFNVLAQKEPS